MKADKCRAEARPLQMMKSKKPNAEQIWKQMEDQVIPGLLLSLTERTIYSYLLRHSHLEGKRELQFSIAWLARGVRFSNATTRKVVRGLARHGVLRLVERSKRGHAVEVRLPEEIRFSGAEDAGSGNGQAYVVVKIEDEDFLRTPRLRQAIHNREGGRCFYCLRRLAPRVRCLDHVVPQAKQGGNGYRNVVSCCLECNSQKGEGRAEDHLRWLFRERRLTADELAGRLRDLDAVAAGKLVPRLPSTAPRNER